MAEKPQPRRRKPLQTARERSQTVAPTPNKRRRQAATQLSRPFRAVGRALQTIFGPFQFVLWPFKTRPMRFVGRILATVLLINYLRSSWQELRKVTWPGRRESWKLTFAVFCFAIVFGLIIASADYGLDKLFHKILLG